MTKSCYFCGFTDPMPFTCKFCGSVYCYNHRLPESHNCPGLLENKLKQSDTGIYYKRAVKRRHDPVSNSMVNIISAIKSNYSLTILILVMISFFLQYIIPGYYANLALSPDKIFNRPWTIVTHIFLHSGPVHIFFNMIFLFFFGPELERRIGGKKFLIVFFLSGIIAAIGYSLWTVFILGEHSTAVGASGAIFGIFACLAVLAPDIIVYVYFIPMKITYALIFFALLDLMFINSSGDLIARSAHLSGVAAGLVFGNYIKKTGHYLHY